MTTIYRILVKAHLDPGWSEHFHGLQIDNVPDGTTEIKGEICDQAMLHGILAQIRDLGLELLVVEQVEARRTANNGHQHE
ncbi:MAG: hypothetical protein AAF702_45925 [Chloroflexota bacterium]